VSDHLAPFALWTAFPSALAGRDACDYYEASVAIGLASRRRSRVRPCRTYRAERRRPTHLLKCPHWASPCAPKVAPANPEHRRRARHRFQTSFRWMSACIVWRLGFGQSSSRHIPRVPQHPAPNVWDGHRFPGMLLSPSPFGSRSAIRPRNLPPSSSQLSWGYDKAPRGAADLPMSAAPAPPSLFHGYGAPCIARRPLHA
jgi:hypothetical protein